jgi:hypothetical protein
MYFHVFLTMASHGTALFHAPVASYSETHILWCTSGKSCVRRKTDFLCVTGRMTAIEEIRKGVGAAIA